MDRMEAYRAHLLADDMSKSLLMAHALSGHAEPAMIVHHISMADDKVRKLAEKFGYRVEKITTQTEDAA